MPVKQPRLMWWWMLPLLLLFTALVVNRIDVDGLWYDEVFTVMNAGGASFGPLSPEGIYEQIVTEDPFQAPGYPWFVAIWGFFVGWSDMALRWSSLIFALLTIAITYRIGRDHLNATTGIFAALVFALSAFTIFYAHELRAFTMMPFCVAILLWGYSRWLTGRDDRVTQFAIFAGAVLMLYAHYFDGLFLIGLALYHLLFVAKNSRWWRPVWLLGGAAICFLPVIPMLIEGMNTYTPDKVPGVALTVKGAIDDLLYYLGNNALLLTLIVLLAGVWRALRERSMVATWIVLTLFGLIILLASNFVLGNLTAGRLRYAMFLWVSASLWAGAGMHFIGAELQNMLQKQLISTRRLRPMMIAVMLIMPSLWLAHGIQAYVTPDFEKSIESDDVPRFRSMMLILEEEGYSSDVFALFNGTSLDAWYRQAAIDYATYNIPMPMFFTATRFEDNPELVNWATDRMTEASRLWYGINREFEAETIFTDSEALLAENFVFCDDYLDSELLSLALYARSAALCPTTAQQLQFGDGMFILQAYDVTQTDETINIAMHWWQDAAVPRETFNLALHLTAVDEATPLVQADVNFGYEAFSPMILELEITDLPAGTYELCTLIYNWRTLERLHGEYYATDETGNRLCLTTFTIE